MFVLASKISVILKQEERSGKGFLIRRALSGRNITNFKKEKKILLFIVFPVAVRGGVFNLTVNTTL